MFTNIKSQLLLLTLTAMLASTSAAVAQTGDTTARTGDTTVQSRDTAAQPGATAARAGDSVPQQAKPAKEIYQLDKVVVSGKQKREPLVNPRIESSSLAPSTAIITRKDLDAQNAKTVTDALKYAPGSLNMTQGRKVKDMITFRGSKANSANPETDFAVDGVWQRDFSTMPTFFSTNDIDHIEIIRSSAILLNGISGTTGLVNIVPRTYDSLGYGGEVEYGTYNTYDARVSHGNRIQDVSYGVAGGYSSTDGPVNQNMAEKMADVSGRVKWMPSSNLLVQANAFYLNGMRQMQVSQPPATNSTQTDWKFDPVTALMANVQGLYRWNDKFSTQILTYFTSRRNYFSGSSLLGSGAARKYTISTSDEIDREAGVTLTQACSFFEGNTLRFGGLLNNWVAPNGKQFFVGKKLDITDFSGVLVDEHTIGPFSANLGVRVVRSYLADYGIFTSDAVQGSRLTTVKNITDTWQDPTLEGNLGATYSVLPGLDLCATGAYAQVKPVPGSVDTSRTNRQAPKNETRYKADLGAVGTLDNIGTLKVSGFYTLQKDGMLMWGMDSTIIAPGNVNYFITYVNRDMAAIGLEIDAHSVTIADWVSVFANAVVQNSTARFKTDMEKDTLKPAIIIGGGLTLTHWDFDLNFEGKYVSKFYDGRFQPNFIPAAVGNFATGDLSLGYAFGPRKTLRAYGSIKNISDKRYETIAGYPDIGRTYAAGVQFRY